MASSDPQSLVNINGEEISPIFDPAWSGAGIPRVLLLAGVLAESGLNPHAERWGRYTAAARSAIQLGDMQWLGGIIDAAWPDISFGYGQQIVWYHYLGDHTGTLENVLNVRNGTFADPGRNLVDMAQRLRACYDRAAGIVVPGYGNDRELASLIIYNAGHFPDPDAESDWWASWRGNVANYASMLSRLRG